jgi:hypothetical protein
MTSKLVKMAGFLLGVSELFDYKSVYQRKKVVFSKLVHLSAKLVHLLAKLDLLSAKQISTPVMNKLIV